MLLKILHKYAQPAGYTQGGGVICTKIQYTYDNFFKNYTLS